MTVDQWCEANSITTANYYYRFREVRKVLLKQLPTEQKNCSYPSSYGTYGTGRSTVSACETNTSVELVSNDITIRVTENTSVYLLEKVPEVARHVK